MTGLSGVNGRVFIDFVDNRALLGNGNYNSNFTYSFKVFGEIVYYNFDESEEVPDVGTGELIVITTIVGQKINQATGNPIGADSWEQYKYSVRVIDNGFSIVPKGSDANPFAGTLEFTAEMKAKIVDEGYEFKLWAKGSKIIIDKVWKRTNSSAPFHELNKISAAHKKLYATDSETCIDMMFKIRPPQSLAGLAGPPLYCLGRCGSPLLVNTGF
jgi:hypothetical protein